MSQDYYSLVTNIGLIKEAEAGQIGENPINLTEIAVGDGNGSYYEPDSAATSLVNELYRTNLTSAVLDANNPNQLIIEGVIEEEAGPFYIREVGIFDADGDLFAIGKYPETFKSNYESGSGKRLYIRLIVAFVSIPNVEIVLSENINFDPNFEANLNIELANRLKISENLADLNDTEQARNNLNITNLTGAIMPFSFSLAPDGWLECNGSEVSRTTYANLFSKIGTNYGVGDGVNTFNIPDLRGEFIRGWDNGRGVDSNRSLGVIKMMN
jgi:phage-related tail fiber protein